MSGKRSLSILIQERKRSEQDGEFLRTEMWANWDQRNLRSRRLKPEKLKATGPAKHRTRGIFHDGFGHAMARESRGYELAPGMTQIGPRGGVGEGSDDCQAMPHGMLEVWEGFSDVHIGVEMLAQLAGKLGVALQHVEEL